MQDDAKLDMGEKISVFVQGNRKGIAAVISVIFILIIGMIVFISLQDVFQKKAISKVEELNTRFDDLRDIIADDPYNSEVQALLTDLNGFAKNKKGFAAGKAWSIIAQIHSNRKDWVNAEEAWLKAAKTADKTYLAPMSLFNAAAAAEEQGNFAEAIEHLEKCIAHPFEFPAAPRAQFSVGRLYEQLNNYPAAVEAYRAVLINWQDFPVWQYLARSRITVIEAM